MLLHKINVKKGQCLTKDASAPKDFFSLSDWQNKAMDLGYRLENNKTRGIWIAYDGSAEVGTYNPTKGGRLYVKDGALSDLFGGLADGLLEVTEKEARDSASDWYDDLGLDEDTKAIIDLFCSKKKIKDHEDLHKLAEGLGIEPSSLEEKVYSLIQAFFSEGRYMSSDAGNIDSKELEMGDKVELEHTKSPIIARRIALDHLAELPDYYTRLAKMEGEGKETSDGGVGSGVKGHVTAEQMKAMKERGHGPLTAEEKRKERLETIKIRQRKAYERGEKAKSVKVNLNPDLRSEKEKYENSNPRKAAKIQTLKAAIEVAKRENNIEMLNKWQNELKELKR